MTNRNSEAFLKQLSEVKTDAEAIAFAKASEQMFVRSLDQLAEDSPEATGRKLTAIEALDAYGKDVLLEAMSEGSALLCESPSAAGKVLKDRRELLRLTPSQIALRAGLDQRVVEEAEKSSRLRIQDYERIARILGLDDRYISAKSVPVGGEKIAIRLRRIGEESARMTPSAVSAIAEAAWVATV